MRALFGIAVVLVACGGLVAEDKKAAKLDGTYLVVGLEANGEKLPAEFFEKKSEAERTITIKGDKITAKKGDGSDDPATFVADASKTPAEIAITSKKGDKDETAYGIFKVDGDTLTICAVENATAADRPKEFKTEKGGKALILVLKKQK